MGESLSEFICMLLVNERKSSHCPKKTLKDHKVEELLGHFKKIIEHASRHKEMQSSWIFYNSDLVVVWVVENISQYGYIYPHWRGCLIRDFFSCCIHRWVFFSLGFGVFEIPCCCCSCIIIIIILQFRASLPAIQEDPEIQRSHFGSTARKLRWS